MYIRSIISAQSLASVPPSRALIERIAGVGVVRPAQERFEFQLVDLLLGPVEHAAQLGDEALVFLAHFDEGGQLVVDADGLVERLEDGVESLQFGDGGLGPLLIVPEIGGGHPIFDRGDLRLLGQRSQRESRNCRIRS